MQFECAVYAFRKITTVDITKSFHATGLYPFSPHFPERFATWKDLDTREDREKLEIIEKSGNSASIIEVLHRSPDTVREIKYRPPLLPF